MRRFLMALCALIPAIALMVTMSVATAPRAAVAQSAITCGDLPAESTPTAASPVAVTARPFPEDAGEVTIFAASSLTDAFNAIGEDLETSNPGLDLVFNFAGSQALVTQLAEGAEADVFASANNTQMQSAVDEGVIVGTPETFATNQLALVVPADNPAGISSPADLGNDGLSIVLAAEDVPVGQYARQSICLMGADTATYGDGFVDAVAGNVVSNETNVKNVLAKIQLGEADAGIVYVTDVTANVADDVLLIEIPASVNLIASYPIAAIEGGNTDAAAAFISYLLSPEGQATLTSFGFSPR